MRIFIYLIILLFVNSCYNAYLKPSSNIKIIENIPFYAQLENQCGPASLAAVLNYYGVEVTPDSIASEIFSQSARGTLNLDMLIYARKKGLNAVQYNGTFEDIKTNIDAGKPLIVLVDFGSFFYSQNHFMVVTGYSDSGIIVNSGNFRGQFIDKERFINAWERTNYWTLLINKKDLQ